MVLTKRRLIVISVALGLFFLLFKVTASFFDESPSDRPRDFEQALRELLEEADRGSARAHYRLGRFFEDGVGIERDVAKAHAWYTLAAAQGLLEASMARDALARGMTREELAEAYRLAVAWSVGGEANPDSAADVSGTVRGTITDDADAALSEGDAAMVSNHLAAGLDPDSVDGKGDTLLNRAVESGNLAVIAAVLDAGADVNAPGVGGRRPLNIAVAAGRDDVVALLIERGANPTLSRNGDPANRTPGGNGTAPSETELDRFATGSGSETAADRQGSDTSSRREISRDLLGTTVGDGRDGAVKTPEKATETQVARRTAPSPDRTVDRDIAPAARSTAQPASIRPDVSATAPRPLSKPGSGSPDASAASNATESRVRTAQYLLARLGYSPGPADGRTGPKTEAAIRAYQKDKGEPPTGALTEDVVAKLDADVIALESRRLAEIEKQSRVDPAPTPTPRPENPDAWANILGGVQKLLGHEFDSTDDPEKMRRYCAKNTENWIYDFGTRRFVLCREFIDGKPAP